MKIEKLEDGSINISSPKFADFGDYETVTLIINIYNGSTYTQEIVADDIEDGMYLVDTDFFDTEELPEGLWDIQLKIEYADSTNVYIDKICYYHDTVVFCQIADLTDKEKSVKLQMHYFFLQNAHKCGDCNGCNPRFTSYLDLITNELSQESC